MAKRRFWAERGSAGTVDPFFTGFEIEIIFLSEDYIELTKNYHVASKEARKACEDCWDAINAALDQTHKALLTREGQSLMTEGATDWEVSIRDLNQYEIGGLTRWVDGKAEEYADVDGLYNL